MDTWIHEIQKSWITQEPFGQFSYKLHLNVIGIMWSKFQLDDLNTCHQQTNRLQTDWISLHNIFCQHDFKLQTCWGRFGFSEWALCAVRTITEHLCEYKYTEKDTLRSLTVERYVYMHMENWCKCTWNSNTFTSVFNTMIAIGFISIQQDNAWLIQYTHNNKKNLWTQK